MIKKILLFIFLFGFMQDMNAQLLFSYKIIDIENTSNNYQANFNSPVNNIRIGAFLNSKLIFGFTNQAAFADYIVEGQEPIQDSLIVSEYQAFARYFLFNKVFLHITTPLSNNYSSLAIQRRDRVGIGYSKTIMNNIDIELAFDMLINENKNGFRKSQISISLTKNINSKKLKQMINMF